jgi:hypothetical protein
MLPISPPDPGSTRDRRDITYCILQYAAAPTTQFITVEIAHRLVASFNAAAPDPANAARHNTRAKTVIAYNNMLSIGLLRDMRHHTLDPNCREQIIAQLAVETARRAASRQTTQDASPANQANPSTQGQDAPARQGTP